VLPVKVRDEIAKRAASGGTVAAEARRVEDLGGEVAVGEKEAAEAAAHGLRQELDAEWPRPPLSGGRRRAA